MQRVSREAPAEPLQYGLAEEDVAETQLYATVRRKVSGLSVPHMFPLWSKGGETPEPPRGAEDQRGEGCICMQGVQVSSLLGVWRTNECINRTQVEGTAARPRELVDVPEMQS